jgi:transcriptional regulator with XRE-family HTH domain
MTQKSPRPLNNQLALFRLRRAMVLKDVAKLLGHRAPNKIASYESGALTPSLKNALKLGIIYNIPIQVLLDGYYEACLKEIRREAGEGVQKMISDESEFCTIEETLESTRFPDGSVLDKARSHTANLIRLRGERMENV